MVLVCEIQCAQGACCRRLAREHSLLFNLLLLLMLLLLMLLAPLAQAATKIASSSANQPLQQTKALSDLAQRTLHFHLTQIRVIIVLCIAVHCITLATCDAHTCTRGESLRVLYLEFSSSFFLLSGTRDTSQSHWTAIPASPD